MNQSSVYTWRNQDEVLFLFFFLQMEIFLIDDKQTQPICFLRYLLHKDVSTGVESIQFESVFTKADPNC